MVLLPGPAEGTIQHMRREMQMVPEMQMVLDAFILDPVSVVFRVCLGIAKLCHRYWTLCVWTLVTIGVDFSHDRVGL